MWVIVRFYKWLVVVPLLLVGPVSGRFAVPSQNEREIAAGVLDGLPVEMRRAFTDTGEFSPIPDPGVSDWLFLHKEKGQTYGQYVRSKPNIPAWERRILYIQPIGEFGGKMAPEIDVLREYTEAYYDPMKVLVLPATGAAGVKSRINGGKRQLLTTDILDMLERRLPVNAYSVLGLTMTDLYAGDPWNFVFGQARIRARVGVFSFARYHPSWRGERAGDEKEVRKLVLRRAAKVLTHETGHMFGIRHCVHYHCNMNGANHLQEADASPMHLCPVCLRKMQHAVKFSPAARYRKLMAFYRKHGLDDECRWVAARLKKIDASGK